VEGGYTPLAWKHLADVLALEWLPSSETPESERQGYRCLRAAALALERGDRGRAGEDVEQAARRLPHSAAPLYHLALLHLDCGEIADARRCFDRAVNLDPSYRGPYSSRGFVYLSEGRFDAAASEFNRLLDLDAGNPFTCVGLARLAMHDRQWRVAETHLRRSLAVSPRLIDSHRCLGEVLATLGRDDDAVAAYERSLALALDGEVSLADPVLTAPAGSGPRDGGHGRVLAALAQLDARHGRVAQAVAGYRLAIAAGYDRVSVRGGLAWLFVKQRRWRAAVTEGARAIAQVPKAVRRAGRHALRDARRAARRWQFRSASSRRSRSFPKNASIGRGGLIHGAPAQTGCDTLESTSAAERGWGRGSS
jgi:tetratricopeptide (TPR) repeat protein